MTTVTENDIRELKDLISNGLTTLIGKIDKLSEEVNDIKVELATVKGELMAINKRIDGLEKRLDDTNKRIDGVDGRIGLTNARINTLTLGFLSIVGILVTGILGIFGKVAFFPNP